MNEDFHFLFLKTRMIRLIWINYIILSVFYYEVKNCQSSENLHANNIKGLWGFFKHWPLPQTENFNLEQNMWFFNWTQDKNIRTLNPVWALVALVKEDNNTKIIKK